MTNKLTKEKIEQVAKVLELRGFECLSIRPYADEDYISFRLPSKYKETYLGTFLNMFSAPYEDRPLLWSDEKAYEWIEIRVGPVYRHNGTKENVSLEIVAVEWHTNVHEFPEKWKYEKAKPWYVEAVQRYSPTNYLEKNVPLASCPSGKLVRIAKLTAKSGAKAVANAVEKAVTACEKFIPNDHSKWAKDPKDYHPDTQVEYNAWMIASKRKRGIVGYV